MNAYNNNRPIILSLLMIHIDWLFQRIKPQIVSGSVTNSNNKSVNNL